ncbi:hypothetical protein IAQ61_009717 [Plenodomus lingam]|uniref:uncharacterized protein n=1 Tax=Leptosphaeria maculans TaxID=5022 RepID=UPI003318202C|nr:hypothetical protein IAQ61_009717 [Plenodomus lingam]
MVRRPNAYSHTRDISSETEVLPATSWTSWTSHLTSSDLDSTSTSTTPPSENGHPIHNDHQHHHHAHHAHNDDDIDDDEDSHLQELGGCIEALGKRRAMQLLFTVPDRFLDFCHFNQTTFFELADWILANVQSQVSADISVEESLFVFLDVVAQGNPFCEVAYRWDHDVKLTQSIFLNILNALNALRALKDVSPTCPTFQKTKKRWEIARRWSPHKQQQANGKIRIGYNDEARGGLEISQAQMRGALEALNNFIHEYTEYDGA